MKILKKTAELVRYLFILPIKLYSKFLSPLFPARCKYYPSCSAYAAEAYRKHGVIMGTVLTAWRLLRCNPWSYGGVDRVPDNITKDYFIPKNMKKKT